MSKQGEEEEQQQQQQQQEEQPREVDAEDDETEAFVNLNDPNFEVLDDGTSKPAAGGAANDDDDDDEPRSEDFVTVKTGEEDGDAADPIQDKNPQREDAFLVFAQEEAMALLPLSRPQKGGKNDEEAGDDDDIAATGEKQQKDDGNEDDKNGSGTTKGPQPLHAVAVSNKYPRLIACGGESEQVHVMQLPESIPLAAVVKRQLAAAQEAAKPQEAAAAAASAVEPEISSAPAAATSAAPASPAAGAITTKQQDPADIAAEHRWPAAATLRGHEDTVTQLAFSPNGAILASAGMDGKVILWNLAEIASGAAASSSSSSSSSNNTAIEPLHVLEDHAGSEVECLLWHPSGAVLCAGASNAQVVMWNAATGAAAQYFSAHRDTVTCLGWTADVKKLVSASVDGSIALSNPKTGVAEVTITRGISRYDDSGASGGPAPGITCLEVMPSPDPLILVGLVEGTVALVSLKEDPSAAGGGGSKGRVIKRAPELHDQTIEQLAISGSEIVAGLRLVASCSCDCKVVLWSVPDLTPRNIFYAGEGVMKVRWMETLLFAACTDGDVRVWESRAVAPGVIAAAGGGAAMAAAAAASAAGAVTPPLVQLMGHRRLVLGMEITRTEKGAAVVTVADDGSSRAFSLVTQPQK